MHARHQECLSGSTDSSYKRLVLCSAWKILGEWSTTLCMVMYTPIKSLPGTCFSVCRGEGSILKSNLVMIPFMLFQIWLHLQSRACTPSSKLNHFVHLFPHKVTNLLGTGHFAPPMERWEMQCFVDGR